MSPPATPWSNQPKALPSKEHSGDTELVLDPVILTPIVIPPKRRLNPHDLGMLIGTSFAVLLILVVYLFFAGGSGGFVGRDSAPAGEAAQTSAAGVPANGGNRGLTIGQVTANDGKTLMVQGVTGATTNVRVTSGTRILVLTGSSLSDVTVGAAVVIYGDKGADGSITANLIVGGSLS